MGRISLPVLTIGIVFGAIPLWAQNACDLSSDGKIDAADVQAAVNMTLNPSTCTANIAGSKVCNVVVVQRVVKASLGGSCLTSTGLHVVSLSWVGSTGATAYKVYRGIASGGPYTLLASPGTTTTYTDTTVVSGSTYYYVVTAIDSKGAASPYSNQSQAVIPIP
jgi:hypothetical protein